MLNKILPLIMAAVLAVPALADAVQLPATGQTACYDANGNTRPCLGTGEDGEKRAGAAWPASRFIDNANETMTDTLTGLIWSKQVNLPAPCVGAAGPLSWQQALDVVKCFNDNGYLGFNDWRLPNVNELESLVNAGAPDSVAWLKARGFTQAQQGLYWTSTNDNSDIKAASEINAWDVDLTGGGLPLTSAKTAARAVWPVRGTSAGPAQLWQTGDTKCFDTAGVRTNPCFPAGQDGELLAGAAWPVPRYRASAGASVAVDNLTGLIWTTESNSPGPAACSNSVHPVTWQDALDHVKCLNQNAFLGITDWRLPNRKELRSLADYATGNPALPDLNPFTAEAAKGNTFWSSTTNAAASKTAWSVSLFDGSVNSADKRNGLLLVWPVSGPDAIPPALTVSQATMTTNVPNATIGGKTETGAKVEVAVNSGPKTPAAVTGADWSAQLSGLSTGANTVTITATDAAGNISTAMSTINVIVPGGGIVAPGVSGPVTIADALKALRIAVGLVTPTADDMLRGDCSPLVNGVPAPDGRIGVDDALLILKKVVGMVNF